ncbi:hypothetical protein MASR2M8_01640 [Opitutaceae bacterium]
MSAAPLPWPEALVGTPGVSVIEQAITRGRLSHSLLLTADDHETLVIVAHAIADRLLNTATAPATFPPEQHPDCFSLRPAGKMRQIRIGDDDRDPGTMREFIRKLSVSASVAAQKVGILHEADRMNVATANAFLKTLEEPPARTTLLLLTTKPYALLPTIRSRVLHFRFPVSVAGFTPDGWNAWVQDYTAWLGRLSAGVTDKKASADAIMTAYGLVARFGAILEFATGEAWKLQKEKIPGDLDEDEQVAIETGLANGLRLRLFAEIARATRAFALTVFASGDGDRGRGAAQGLVAAISRLEHDVGLLRLNLNESAALEAFMLGSLRLWTAKR